MTARADVSTEGSLPHLHTRPDSERLKGRTDQAVQPSLVAVDHRIGIRFRESFCRLALLSFLGKDAHSPPRQVLNEPSVVYIQASFTNA